MEIEGLIAHGNGFPLLLEPSPKPPYDSAVTQKGEDSSCKLDNRLN